MPELYDANVLPSKDITRSYDSFRIEERDISDDRPLGL
jgi:hypothetical protein